jgi:hypothetical protein
VGSQASSFSSSSHRNGSPSSGHEESISPSSGHRSSLAEMSQLIEERWSRQFGVSKPVPRSCVLRDHPTPAAQRPPPCCAWHAPLACARATSAHECSSERHE